MDYHHLNHNLLVLHQSMRGLSRMDCHSVVLRSYHHFWSSCILCIRVKQGKKKQQRHNAFSWITYFRGNTIETGVCVFYCTSKKKQTYKPDSVSQLLKILIIYLGAQLLTRSIFLPFDNGRDALKCRYT